MTYAERPESFLDGVSKYTELLLRLSEEDHVEDFALVLMCAKWMSEDQIREMLEANELLPHFEHLLGRKG